MTNLITSRRRVRGARRPAATMVALLVAGGVGALAEYFFFDRQNGARRRHIARDRTRASFVPRTCATNGAGERPRAQGHAPRACLARPAGLFRPR